jgi:hypothetical protein
MSIHGIDVTATLTSSRITDSEAERVYLSLEQNFALKSVDMFVDQDANTLSFLFGVESPDWAADAEEFVRGVVTDALTKAFSDGNEVATPHFSEARVGAFC